MYTKIFLTETKDNMFWYKTPYLLGQSEKWETIIDNGSLITIGNQTFEDPIKLNFKNKGLYRLSLNLISHMGANLTDNIFTIECGGKKNKIYTIGNHMGTLSVAPPYNSEKFSCNFSSLLQANENEISSISVIGHNCWNMSAKTGLYGHPEEIWSSISLEFIPDSTETEESEPVMVNSDSPLKMNRRHLINAPAAKILQLSIDHNQCKIGDWIEIKTIDKGLAKINTGSNVDVIMNGKKTRAINGYLLSSIMGDFLRLECIQISPKIIFTDTMRVGKFIVM